MKSKYPLKSGQLTDKIALKEEDNVFIGQNEFVEPIIVADPVDDAHAVNKGWVEENYKIQLVKIRDVNTLSPNDDTFLSLNNLIFVEGDIPILLGSGYKEIIVDEAGLYEIKFVGNATIIDGALYVLINDSQQDPPLLFSGSNGVIASGSFVYKLESDDTIKFKASNQVNSSNSMSFTIVIQKLN